jgi:hypothetical protein
MEQSGRNRRQLTATRYAAKEARLPATARVDLRLFAI